MTETRRGFFGQLLGGLAVALGVKAATPAMRTETIGWWYATGWKPATRQYARTSYETPIAVFQGPLTLTTHRGASVKVGA
jgi:hypothetical protein